MEPKEKKKVGVSGSNVEMHAFDKNYLQAAGVLQAAAKKTAKNRIRWGTLVLDLHSR